MFRQSYNFITDKTAQRYDKMTKQQIFLFFFLIIFFYDNVAQD